MKKMICLVGVLVFLAAVAFAGSKIPITKQNLKNVKGTWNGFAEFFATSTNMRVQILSDTEPVQGKLQLTNIPSHLAQEQLGKAMDELTLEGKNGRVTSEGTLMFVGGGESGNVFECWMEGPKLVGWFYYNGAKATFSLSK